MDVWHWFGWTVVTIVVPVAIPLFAQSIAYWGEDDPTLKPLVHPMAAVKDGQLIWVTVAIAMVGAYELPDIHHLNGLLLGFLMVVLIGCAVLFGKSAGKVAPYPAPLKTLTTFWVSLFFLVVTVLCALAIHYQVRSTTQTNQETNKLQEVNPAQHPT
jgi:CDP-diglyceride synthetase